MSITVIGLQVGRVRSEGDPQRRDWQGRYWTSAFRKESVDGPLRLTESGFVGDEIADRRNHGGPDKAALVYAESHYPRWRATHTDLDFGPGGFGENLTVRGADESTVCLGDRYRLGTAEVQISQPRQPCWKISRRWGRGTLTKEVAQTGRTGWYLRVLRPGAVGVGDRMELTERPHPQWSVARANDVLFGREVDRAAAVAVMAIPELADAWKDSIA